MILRLAGAPMRRREFITVLGGAAVWPLGAYAQSSEPARVAVLIGVADDAEGRSRLAAFQKGMQDLGWVDGRNLKMDVRFTAGITERTQAYAAELVGTAPRVIMANTNSAVAAIQQQTRA